ncbi:hypothetical protein O181_121821 [Austropuccinia psidii MF-1]|uniref:Uncharacterized protein n=1 Tax=Austropuccinia psidii MF-1 TaxID=1389203 RepID=A0A9Q3KKC2_9BASI|nr:hypothetical protein [Austropuccinia psidii MF-1]
MLETHATLRQTKQRLAKQESQNREDSQSKKPILPGTYHEDEAEEEMKIIVPTKYKDKHTKRDERFEGTEIKKKRMLKTSLCLSTWVYASICWKRRISSNGTGRYRIRAQHNH